MWEDLHNTAQTRALDCDHFLRMCELKFDVVAFVQISILYGRQVSTYGTTPRPRMTLWLSLCLVYSHDSPGSYSHVSHGVESFHVIALHDCTCSHTNVFNIVRVKYRKGMYLVTIVTSVPWDMEWVLRSWPCYELHSSVASFEEIWDVVTKLI